MKLTNILYGCAPLAEPTPRTQTRGGIAFAKRATSTEVRRA